MPPVIGEGLACRFRGVDWLSRLSMPAYGATGHCLVDDGLGDDQRVLAVDDSLKRVIGSPTADHERRHERVRVEHDPHDSR